VCTHAPRAWVPNDLCHLYPLLRTFIVGRFALVFKRRLVERLTHLSVAPEEQARQRAISHALLRNAEVRLTNLTCRLRSTPGDPDPFTAAVSVSELRLGRLDNVRDASGSTGVSGAGATTCAGKGAGAAATGTSAPTEGDDESDSSSGAARRGSDDGDHVARKDVSISGISVRWTPGNVSDPPKSSERSPNRPTVAGDASTDGLLGGADAVVEGVSVSGVLSVTAVGGSHGAVRHQFVLRAPNSFAVRLTSEQVASATRHTARWSARGAAAVGLFDPAPRARLMTPAERWRYAASRVLSRATTTGGPVCWPAVRVFCVMRREYIGGLRAGGLVTTEDGNVTRLESVCSVQEIVLFRHLATLQQVRSAHTHHYALFLLSLSIP
jgi:hypothetical protein